MRRVLAALCLLVGLSAEAQVRTVWANQAATATSSAYDTGRAQHTNIQIIGSSVVGTVDIEKSNDCTTAWTVHQTLTDPSNTFLTLPSWACTRLVFTRTSGTITLATIEPVRTGRNGTMVGATSGAAGVAGLVPPPQAGDEAKVLLGDGTWGVGGGGSGDITGVTVTGTAPVSVSGSPCTTADCAFTFALTGVTLDANGWTQSVPVTGGDADKGYVWNVATSGGYPDFGMSLVLGGLTLTGDDQEFTARKKITVKSNATGGANSGFCYHDGVTTEQCLQFNFGTGVLSLPNVTLANPLAVADGGTGVSSFGQNTILAGPTSGGAGTATARSLVAGDLPTVPVAGGGTGATDAATALTNLGAAAAAHGVTTGAIPYASSSTAWAATELTRVAQDSYRQVRGTNAQTMAWCMTFTDASNYSCLRYNSSSNVQQLMTDAIGSGAGTNGLRIGTVSNDIRFWVGADRVQISSSQMYPTTSDAMDLGHVSSLPFKSLYLARSIQGSKSKALVDATATNLWQVAVANNSYEGLNLDYTIFATNGTDRQTLVGSVKVAINNNGGTETCVFSTPSEAVNPSTGTLAVTWDCTAGTDTVMIRATADTSLASTTTFTAESRINLTSGTATVTPQ